MSKIKKGDITVSKSDIYSYLRPITILLLDKTVRICENLGIHRGWVGGRQNPKLHRTGVTAQLKG